MKKQTEDWIKAANDDLEVIEEIINNENLTNMVAFHSEQAIEKLLKSILEEYEAIVPRIHNIVKLKEMIEKYINLDVDKIFLEQVNEIYIDSRYPSDIGLVPTGKPTIETAKSFYEFAKIIKEKIVLKLGT